MKSGRGDESRFAPSTHPCLPHPFLPGRRRRLLFPGAKGEEGRRKEYSFVSRQRRAYMQEIKMKLSCGRIRSAGGAWVVPLLKFLSLSLSLSLSCVCSYSCKEEEEDGSNCKRRRRRRRRRRMG